MDNGTRTHSAKRASPWAFTLTVLLLAGAALGAVRTEAQELPTDPLTPEELETLVGPIALYPDDVVAIILPAATYPLEIVQAARFLEDREADPNLEPSDDWDESVVALLNYPDAVQLLNDDLDWTWDLGEAVLDDEAAVLDAIQSFRNRAYDAGNLVSDDRQVVTEDDGVIAIAPADPEVVYIPYYEPTRVVVHQPVPVFHYYPLGYPLYYYPYPYGYHFRTGFFWGVTSAFVIGWHSHLIHVHHHTHYGHPYFSWNYYTPYYTRSRVYVTVNVNNYRDVWQPHRWRGARPYDGRRASRSTGRQRTYDGRRYRYTDTGDVRPATRRDREPVRNRENARRPLSSADRPGRTLTSAERARSTPIARSTSVPGNRGVRATASRPQRPARVSAQNRISTQNQPIRRTRIAGTATDRRPPSSAATGSARDARRLQPRAPARTSVDRGARLTPPSAARSTVRSPAPSRRTAPPTRPTAPSTSGAARLRPTNRATNRAVTIRAQRQRPTSASRQSATTAARSGAGRRIGGVARQSRAARPSASRNANSSARGQRASSGGRAPSGVAGRR